MDILETLKRLIANAVKPGEPFPSRCNLGISPANLGRIIERDAMWREPVRTRWTDGRLTHVILSDFPNEGESTELPITVVDWLSDSMVILVPDHSRQGQGLSTMTLYDALNSPNLSPVQKTKNLIDAFCAIWPRANFGPGHIALDDYNLSDEQLQRCIELTKATLGESTEADVIKQANRIGYLSLGHTEQELRATLLFLQTLLLIPEDKRFVLTLYEDGDKS